ncbi:MAG TPA: tetratricopeptide repeat protein [Pyrinomonadaceae bacterium]|nr:tetratricopeptide repeat protein [Pyrinomonadaceae bacterium]
MSVQGKQLYQFGQFRLDPVKRRLTRDGELVKLTPKAFETLLALVEQRGKTIEKDELLNKVWAGVAVEENNLNQCITVLRKSLGDSRQESQYIATIPGVGYRFVAEVTDVADLGETEAPVVKPNVADPAPANPPRVARPLRYALLIAVPLALAAVVFALLTREKSPQPGPAVSSIMVLPLENLSGDPSQEYFADGVTDALIGDLAKIRGLHVISRTSSMHYKKTKKSLPEIAREIKVDAIVEGTVQRSGDRVVIRAQLIRAATDHHVWVKTYERPVRDVLDLQSEIAQTIAREVQIQMTPADQARLTTRHEVSPKAFDQYLQGRYLYWNRRTEENLNKAIEHFQNAIREDPNYSSAYVGLADCYGSLGMVQIGALPPLDARRLAEENAAKALALDPTLAEAHTALGYVNHYNWNWDAAEEEFKRAIELNPSYANAHNFYAGFLMSRGRVEEAIASSNRARELDPFSLSISAQRGFLLENARRYSEAIEQLQGVLAMDPNHYQAHWFLGHTYAANKQFDKAIAASEKAVELSDRAPGALGILGLVYGLAGREDDANKILSELLELNKRRYVTPVALVNVYIGLGQHDEAFVWLEKAFQERSNYLAYLKVFPLVDPLRSDPRYVDLVRRIGLS